MSHIDILIERLKGFEETQLLELLDLTSEEIVDRFKDVIYNRRDYLFGEVEMLASEDEEELDFDSSFDGYQVEDMENE
jgi:hypothetical protein